MTVWLTATGDGDKMMRFCPAFHAVQLMKEVCVAHIFTNTRQIGRQCCTTQWRHDATLIWIVQSLTQLISSSITFQGYSPQESCELVVKEAQRKAGTTSKPFEMALIAINKKVFWYHIAFKSYFTVFMKTTCSKCMWINLQHISHA